MQSPPPALDPGAIAELRTMAGDEPTLVSQIIDCYLQESPSLMAAMREAVSQQNGAALMRAAHSLKSSSQSLGAIRMAEICLELEQMGRSGTMASQDQEIAAAMAQLAAEYHRVETALDLERDRR
ncbi:Hpt domain-containing protein [Leptolyngbya ohadii]|uniref:Hpt domain-containing protein n=1 Tax=Leptolyngbya ohadii TaxID=1962290 RepID=UPI000B59C8DE|nr:Hpt domain-containing protein [Leptolyngbya ohadii]